MADPHDIKTILKKLDEFKMRPDPTEAVGVRQYERFQIRAEAELHFMEGDQPSREGGDIITGMENGLDPQPLEQRDRTPQRRQPIVRIADNPDFHAGAVCDR